MPRHPAETHTLDKTVEALDRRYGLGSIKRATELPVARATPRIGSGFAALDALTGLNGLPCGHITLFSGRTTSGKLSIAYRALTSAQGSGQRKNDIAVLDCSRTSDPDTIARNGVDLAHTLFVRPPDADGAVPLVFDLLNGFGLRALLIDGLGDLLRSRRIAHGFDAALPQLAALLRQSGCALICLDEPAPPWLRWFKLGSAAIAHAAGLHIEIQRARWDYDPRGDVRGYVAAARVLKSRWAAPGGRCEITLAVPV
jgi:RecA/RadA recombinase